MIAQLLLYPHSAIGELNHDNLIDQSTSCPDSDTLDYTTYQPHSKEGTNPGRPPRKSDEKEVQCIWMQGLNNTQNIKFHHFQIQAYLY